MKNTFSRIAISCLLIISIQQFSYAQSIPGIEVLKYHYYTSYFSTTEHIPIVVTYTLTKDMLDCTEKVERTNRFSSDPEHKGLTNLAKDYRNSGYDRGHNMSAADNKCNEDGMRECFYFSNMTPQPHSFNAGKWEDLEKFERQETDEFNKIIVTIGSVGVFKKIGEDNVVVPNYMWKVIYIPSSDTYLCYYFPDSDGVTGNLNEYKVSLNEIEEKARINFNGGVVSFANE